MLCYPFRDASESAADTAFASCLAPCRLTRRSSRLSDGFQRHTDNCTDPSASRLNLLRLDAGETIRGENRHLCYVGLGYSLLSYARAHVLVRKFGRRVSRAVAIDATKYALQFKRSKWHCVMYRSTSAMLLSDSVPNRTSHSLRLRLKLRELISDTIGFDCLPILWINSFHIPLSASRS